MPIHIQVLAVASSGMWMGIQQGPASTYEIGGMRCLCPKLSNSGIFVRHSHRCKTWCHKMVLHVNSLTWVEWWMDIGRRVVVVQFSTSGIPSVTTEWVVGALLLTWYW